mmetsp:Transcript_9024/g.31061  ORF Transcript_9024/g.31061 Transcript_9024/m.31061 type:complete len:139 (+) Transcript_9024:304-720(+)
METKRASRAFLTGAHTQGGQRGVGLRGRKEKKKVLRAMSHPFGETSLPHPTGGKGGLDGTTELSATSAKFNVGLGAPSCPVNLRVDRELLQSSMAGEAGGAGAGLPIEVRRLAGDFVDSEQCSAVPQGWWKWWRYQGL